MQSCVEKGPRITHKKSPLATQLLPRCVTQKASDPRSSGPTKMWMPYRHDPAMTATRRLMRLTSRAAFPSSVNLKGKTGHELIWGSIYAMN